MLIRKLSFLIPQVCQQDQGFCMCDMILWFFFQIWKTLFSWYNFSFLPRYLLKSSSSTCIPEIFISDKKTSIKNKRMNNIDSSIWNSAAKSVKPFLNMWIYLVIIVIVWLIWRMKDYFDSDMLRDYSNTQTPILKSAFNLAFSGSGLKFFLIKHSKVHY